MAYERLTDFVQDCMMMPHVYRTVMLMTLLLKMSANLQRGGE
ncbi:MAG TPA: hypothetical protein VEZ19_14655 [Rubrobacter sp.]|jgi:hypothetical protein|nr:hypothetical protein [Rubrobacter sp.]